jgi:hypothetical protein
MTAAAPTTTAEDIARLLAERECSAACLLSRPDSACRCRCLGRFHGLALAQLAGRGPDARQEQAEPLTGSPPAQAGGPQGGRDLCEVCEEAREHGKWCNKHYRRWLRTGDPLKARPRGGNQGGSQVRGSAHGMSKLTGAKVLEIRERHAAGESQGVLGHEFGVSDVTVNAIVNGRTWRHIGGPVRGAGPRRSGGPNGS